jgi:hypothetical protein
MPTSRHTTTVEFDDELWELVEAEAAHAGVSVPHFVRDAVIARIVVGPADPRIFEVFAETVRTAMGDQPHPARRQAERSLGALARLSAARRRDEARALRAQSAQVVRMSQQRLDRRGEPADQPDPLPGARAVFRANPDWTEIRTVDSRPPDPDATAPDLDCLREEHIHPDDRVRVRAAMVDAVDARAIFEVQYRVPREGRVRLIHLRALPLLTAAGAITEWVAVATDSTDVTN